MIFSGYQCDTCCRVVKDDQRAKSGQWLTVYEQHKPNDSIPLDFCSWNCLLSYAEKRVQADMTEVMHDI
jgi:macrodomain Ter protein organizer (MatP/YcbG family)